MRSAVLRFSAPVAAVAFAIGVAAAALLLAGANPLEAFGQMLSYGTQTNSLVSELNRAIPLYLSALAVGIGFKMGLFNIGVEGQYLLAALLAASAGAAVALPPGLHVVLILAVAMLVGSAWAGIAGALKVWRGVHEVISTIMLNFIAIGISAYLFSNYLREEAEGLTLRTPELAASGRIPSLNPVLSLVGVDPGAGANLQGFLLLAIAAGAAYWLLVWRTRFGFDLRASGMNPGAAAASGVNPKRMILATMLISGAFAGLVGMSPLLGFFHRYTSDFPTGLGFTGIAVALVGRNHPVGMALAALLFGFLDRSAQILDLADIPKEIVTIIQGSVILAVVVAYELARRALQAQQAQAAAEQLQPEPTGAAA